MWASTELAHLASLPGACVLPNLQSLSSLKGGICERAFPPDISNDCSQQCHLETCPQYCQLVESRFPSQSSEEGMLVYSVCQLCAHAHCDPFCTPAVSYSGTLELSMDYTSNVTLKEEGVLEFQISYLPPPPPSPPLNSTLPLGVAYGLIWKVTYSEGAETVEQYISQVCTHNPGILH